MTDLQMWEQLPSGLRSMFENAASGNPYTPYEWFTHLVPESLNPFSKDEAPVVESATA